MIAVDFPECQFRMVRPDGQSLIKVVPCPPVVQPAREPGPQAATTYNKRSEQILVKIDGHHLEAEKMYNGNQI